MIIVTGTKRSGTSMWMQLLKAVGLPVLGSAFPRNWASSIRDANQAGFYESSLRSGIYYATNPHPKTGAYLFPQETRRVVVKVFVPGLVRTDHAFVDHVIATMRNVREYGPSVARLYAMEHAHKRALAVEKAEDPESIPLVEHMPAELEWWSDNFALLSDALTRRYPLHMMSYDSVLDRPAEVVSQAIDWLGAGDPAPAIALVQQELRTQRDSEGSYELALEPDVLQLCDELYLRVDKQEPLTGVLIDSLNEANSRLLPRLREARRRVQHSRARMGRARRPQSSS